MTNKASIEEEIQSKKNFLSTLKSSVRRWQKKLEHEKDETKIENINRFIKQQEKFIFSVEIDIKLLNRYV